LNLSIKNVPEPVVERLRLRARRNHRSLQGELSAILEETVSPRRLSVEEARRQLAALGYQTGDESMEMIRRDRDAR
jgi:plasmid stability protein